MTELYGLGPRFAEKWLALPDSVGEDEWRRIVELAVASGTLDESDISPIDAAAVLDGQRQLKSKRGDAIERILFHAMLKDCCTGRWGKEPGGRMFLNLHTCVSGPREAGGSMESIWCGLLALVNPEGEYEGPALPRWLRRAYGGQYKGLTPPEGVARLSGLITSAPEVLPQIVAAAEKEDQIEEGRALLTVAEFLHRMAGEAVWVLGTEDGS